MAKRFDRRVQMLEDFENWDQIVALAGLEADIKRRDGDSGRSGPRDPRRAQCLQSRQTPVGDRRTNHCRSVGDFPGRNRQSTLQHLSFEAAVR